MEVIEFDKKLSYEYHHIDHVFALSKYKVYVYYIKHKMIFPGIAK
jgi:hypothetical protein